MKEYFGAYITLPLTPLPLPSPAALSTQSSVVIPGKPASGLFLHLHHLELESAKPRGGGVLKTKFETKDVSDKVLSELIRRSK